ncbi:MAG TPA: porin family protein [Sphingobacteriaceae bacterium]
MKINGELRNRWKLVFTVLLGFLFFSIQTNAQDQDSVSIQSQTTTTTTTSDTDVVDDNDRDDDYDNDDWGPRAGIKGGLNVSNLIVDDVTDRNARIGFHAGVYGQLFSSRAFAIQPEVNFSTKGNKITIADGIIDQETKFNLSYIDIPVLAVFKLGKAAEIHAGAYWAYLVGANIDADGDLDNDFTRIDRDNFDKWDYGLVGGLGFNLGKGAQLGARYNYGLNEIANSAGARRMLGNTKNSVAQLYLAFNLAAQ